MWLLTNLKVEQKVQSIIMVGTPVLMYNQMTCQICLVSFLRPLQYMIYAVYDIMSV